MLIRILSALTAFIAAFALNKNYPQIDTMQEFNQFFSIIILWNDFSSLIIS